MLLITIHNNILLLNFIKTSALYNINSIGIHFVKHQYIYIYPKCYPYSFNNKFSIKLNYITINISYKILMFILVYHIIFIVHNNITQLFKLFFHSIKQEECNTFECNFDSGECTYGIEPYKDCKIALEGESKCFDLFNNTICDSQCNTEVFIIT